MDTLPDNSCYTMRQLHNINKNTMPVHSTCVCMPRAIAIEFYLYSYSNGKIRWKCHFNYTNERLELTVIGQSYKSQRINPEE